MRKFLETLLILLTYVFMGLQRRYLSGWHPYKINPENNFLHASIASVSTQKFQEK